MSDHHRLVGSRRALLRAGIALGVSAGSRRVLGAETGTGRSVLVLGAGMAGLTAALALLRAGHDVRVVEYQPRVGGRLWSLPLADGQFTELGGGHFRSNMPYVLAYIRRFQLPVLSLNDGLPRYMIGGQVKDAADLANWPWPLSPEERGVTVASNLNRYLYRAGMDTSSVLSASWPSPETLARLDGITVGALVRSGGGSDAFCALLDAHGGTFTSRSHALGAIPDLAYHFGDQNLIRIKGGNERLPVAMAEAIGWERIHLNAPVVSIDQSGPQVRVAVQGGQEFSADAVVSTIPSTVLSDLAVTPVWSDRKRRMIGGMEWDKTVKVVVQTQTPSWLAKGVRGWPMAGGDRPWERFIDITGNEPGGRGNGFFYLNGTNADAVLARPAGERAPSVLAQFRADMPDLFDGIVTEASVAWSEQPWVRGSFGNEPVGGGWMVEEWKRPEGRIHFAGDWTTLKSGWVEGAIESGLRAARQIDPISAPEGHAVVRR